ncbi:MAG: hypothetical protein ACFFBP_17340 [Promethearchaeota archaeon]
MTDYKLAPIKKLLKKVVDEAGTPESILRIAMELGMLSHEELDVLLKLKHGEQVDASKREILDILLQKNLIQKK